jgi:hypothetical protein
MAYMIADRRRAQMSIGQSFRHPEIRRHRFAPFRTKSISRQFARGVFPGRIQPPLRFGQRELLRTTLQATVAGSRP